MERTAFVSNNLSLLERVQAGRLVYLNRGARIIVRNVLPYIGDETFLAASSRCTQGVWEKLQLLEAKREERAQVDDMWASEDVIRTREEFAEQMRG